MNQPPSTSAAIHLREFSPIDRVAVGVLLDGLSEFAEHETAVASTLLDEIVLLGPDSSCSAVVAYREGRCLGYACFGPTPMTCDTWDLYWIAADATVRGQGVGRRLHDAAVDKMRKHGAARVRVETSMRPSLAATRSFYETAGYSEVGRIADFFGPGDSLVTLVLDLDGGRSA